MDIGIFAKTFSRGDLSETLDAVVASGLTTIQFNMALTTAGTPMPGEIPLALAAQVGQEVARRDLKMAAVSGTYNMAHPDATVREAGRLRLGALIAAARTIGTRLVTLCTGSRCAEDMWRHHPDNATPEAWRDMRASVEAALGAAETHGVTLGFEPEHNNIVNDAAAGRRLLDELGSPPHLKVVIDPANLFPAGHLEHQADTLKWAFELLGADLALAHAKDVTTDGALVAAGRGALDYDLYISLLRLAPRDVAVVMHGLSEAEVPGCRAFIETVLARTRPS
jgi:sugar phosphate isomerase/epimerase